MSSNITHDKTNLVSLDRLSEIAHAKIESWIGYSDFDARFEAITDLCEALGVEFELDSVLGVKEGGAV